MSEYDAGRQSAWESPSRDIRLAALFSNDAGLLTGEDYVIGMTITRPYTSGALTIGEVCTGQCDLSMYNPGSYAWRDANFSALLGVYTTGKNYTPMGYYYVDSVSSDDNWKTINITAYDYSTKLDKTFTPSIELPCTPNALFNDLKAQFGINGWLCPNDIGSEIEFTDAIITEFPEGTAKDYLGWIAGLIGCNAMFVYNNLVSFVRPHFAGSSDDDTLKDYVITRDIQYLQGLDITEDSFTVHSLTSGSGDNTLVSGNGTGITFENPFMTQEILDGLLDVYDGLTYYPCTVEWRGFPAIQAGYGIYVETSEGTYLPTICMNMTWDLTSGCKCTTEADTTETDVGVAESPTEREINKVYDQLKQAIADATELMYGSKGGVFKLIDSDGDGVNDGFTISDSPSPNISTHFVRANSEGIAFSTNGGQTYTNAITQNGIVASAITTGQMSAEHISVNGNTLTEYLDIDSSGITIGNTAAGIKLKQTADAVEFIDDSGTVLADFTPTSFDIVNLNRFRIGSAQIVVQPNSSISLTGVS